MSFSFTVLVYNTRPFVKGPLFREGGVDNFVSLMYTASFEYFITSAVFLDPDAKDELVYNLTEQEKPLPG